MADTTSTGLFAPEDRAHFRPELEKLAATIRACRAGSGPLKNRIGEAIIACYDEGQDEMGLCLAMSFVVMNKLGPDLLLSVLLDMAAVAGEAHRPGPSEN